MTDLETAVTDLKASEELLLSRDVGGEDQGTHLALYRLLRDLVQVIKDGRVVEDTHSRAPVVILEHRHVLQIADDTNMIHAITQYVTP